MISTEHVVALIASLMMLSLVIPGLRARKLGLEKTALFAAAWIAIFAIVAFVIGRML